MAIFTPSTVISEIRGSIGLETYSRNRYRPYVKARVSPIQPNTTYQLGSRAVMQYVCSEYNALTEEQKLIYEVAASQQKGIARIGEKPALTGRDLFIRIRTIFAYSGVVDPDTPAGLRPLPLFINFGAYPTSTSFVVDTETTLTNDYLVIYMGLSAPVSASRRSIKSQPITWLRADWFPTGHSIINVFVLYESRHGITLAANAGKKIFYKMKVADAGTGMSTIVASGSVIITI